MDEMKIGSNFMKRIIAKLIKKLIRHQLGYEMDILLNELDAHFVDGKAHVHLNVDAEMSKDELIKIIGTVGL